MLTANTQSTVPEQPSKRLPFLRRLKYFLGENTHEQRLVLLQTRQKLLDLHTTAAIEFAKNADSFDLGLHRYVTTFQLDNTTAAIVQQLATLKHYCGERKDV